MALQGERRRDDYPSVSFADSSPDKGSQTPHPPLWGTFPQGEGIAGDRKGRPYKCGVTTPQSATPTAPLAGEP